ncbi:uncharacterized protein LOC135218562 [Macrobrachium nipponense]|uniref:uncharacterized protein LOC135218562 n=1 Tax=Macrobrachium nipponense TaxID=159736 RepID=UPI0030C7AA84
MEKNVWNPGVWKKWEARASDPESGREIKFSYSYIPSNDWSNVGPVLSYGTESESYDETFERETTSSAVQDQNYKFVRIKNVSKKFPLKKSFKFAYPLTNPSAVHQMCRCQENDNFLWHQGGNNLDTIEVQGKTFLVYPEVTPNQEQRIIVSEMVQRNFVDAEEGSDKVFYCCKKRSKIFMDCSGEICQVLAKEINNKYSVLTRSKNAIHYCSLKNDFKLDASVSIHHSTDKDAITSATLNDAVPGYFATADSSGLVSLYDSSRSNNNEPIWEHSLKGSRCVYQCDFGRHALSLIVNNKSSVWLCDTRSKPTSGNDNKMETLFNVRDLEGYISPLDIICKVVRSGLHNLYTITSSTVLLMDERYCKLPALKWDHTLTASPSFTTRCMMKNFEVLMFGSSCDFRLCSLYQDLSNKAISQGVSGLPSYLNIVRDTLQFAHQQNIWFNTYADRIGNGVTGISLCINPCDESSLCLLTLNNTGDIFIQDFHVQSNSSIPVSDNQERVYDRIGKQILQTWENQVIELTMNEKNKQGLGEKKNGINLSKLYSDMEDNAKMNDFCSDGSREVWSVQNYVLYRFATKKLKYHNFVKDNLSSGEEGLAKFLPQEFSQYLKPNYYKNFKDDLSTSLVELWKDQMEGKEGIGSSPFKYRLPPQLNNVSFSAKKLKVDHTVQDTTFDDDTSFFFTPKKTDLDVFSTPVHLGKSELKRSAKRKVDGF